MLRHPDLENSKLHFRIWKHFSKVCGVSLGTAASLVCACLSSLVSFCAESFKDSAACRPRGVPGCSGGFWGLLHGAPTAGLDAPLRLSQKAVGGTTETVHRRLLHAAERVVQQVHGV